MVKATILIPAYNSQETIKELVYETNDIFYEQNIEFIVVNDCSYDATHEKCLELYKEFQSKFTYLKLKKNYGEHNAVMAGLNYCKGEKVFIIDDDFQNDPSELKKLYEFSFENNFDVVYSKYKKKKHNFFRNFVSKINDKFANFILNKPKKIYLSSFKSINKNIVDEIIKYTGPSPYIDGIIFNITSNIGQIEVDHMSRKKGKSGYNIFKLLQLFSNVAFNFSTKPLRIISFLGFFLSFLSFLLGTYILLEKLFNPDLPLGYASIVLIFLFFSGIQLTLIGLLGEYLGKVLSVVNKQPQYSLDLLLKKKD